MGEAPSWYSILQAARYLGVPPWDLIQRPTPWIDMAIGAMNAEEHARKMHDQDSRLLGRR